MSNNNCQKPKIKMMSIINDAFKLYRENFRLLIILSTVAFLINQISKTLDLFQNQLNEYKMVFLLYSLFWFIMSLLLMYYGIKFSIAIYVSITERYIGENIDIKGALNIASQRFWKFIGVSIQLILIISMPILGVIGPYFLLNQLVLKWIIIAVFTVITVYLGTIYGFAPLIIIIDKTNKRYFKTSKKLVMGYIWETVILTLIVYVVFAAPYYLYIYVFNDYKTIPLINKYLISSLNQLLFVFVNPFIYSIYVILFFKLKEANNMLQNCSSKIKN